ncbi:hypothetical protein BH10ACI3_BH10ACI3_07950 [soil metagenome]
MDPQKPGKPQKLFFKHIIRKIFLEDWALKLIALVITFGLWFGVTGLSTPTTKRLTVPLVPSISNNTQITNTLIQDVDIVISGDKRRIEQVKPGDLEALLDLTDVPPGDRVISLSPENVSVALPQGIKLVEIPAYRIPVNLEAVEEKEVEVKIISDGMPAPGYEVYNSSSLPPKIRVRGPASFIKTLEYVQTEKIDLTGKKGEFTAKQVAVAADNPKAAVLNTVVDVYFRIGEKRVARSFTIAVAGSPGKTASFTLYGPKTLLSKAKADSFKVEDGAEPQLILPADLVDLVEIRKLAVK